MGKKAFLSFGAIIFNILTDCRGQKDTYRNVRKTDWNLYRTLLEEKIDTLDRQGSLDTQAESLSEIISASYLDSCRLVTTNLRKFHPNVLV